MKNAYIASLALAFSMACAPLATSAAVLTFDDRAAWRATAGGGSGDLQEDFDVFTGTNLYGSTALTAGDFTFSTVRNNGSDTSWSIRDVADLAGSKTVNGSSYVSLVSFGSNGEGNTNIAFSTSVFAFGFDYAGPSNTPSNDANPLTLLTSQGQITGPDILGASAGFFGFVFDAGEFVSSVEVADLADLRTFFGADNFEAFSDVAPIPLPGSGLLLIAGLGGMAVVRKKRRNKT